MNAKLPPYRIFRSAPGAVVIVMQVSDPETGEAVEPADLEAYQTSVKIDTPWYGLEKLPVRSRMLLTPRTARFLLAAGSIISMEEPGLVIISRNGAERPGGPPAPALDTARKARSDA